MAVLTKAEIHEQLKSLPGWLYEGKSIHKAFTFKSFMPGIDFVNKVAGAAEQAGHHPDLTIRYNVIGVSLATHSEGGITERDLSLARQIDRIAANIS